MAFACKANNAFTALALLANGGDSTIPNHNGLMPFDLVPDLDEWINLGIFEQSMVGVMESSFIYLLFFNVNAIF